MYYVKGNNLIRSKENFILELTLISGFSVMIIVTHPTYGKYEIPVRRIAKQISEYSN
jgi:hypothetical protein